MTAAAVTESSQSPVAVRVFQAARHGNRASGAPVTKEHISKPTNPGYAVM